MVGTNSGGRQRDPHSINYWFTNYLTDEIGLQDQDVNNIHAKYGYNLQPKVMVVDWGNCAVRWSILDTHYGKYAGKWLGNMEPQYEGYYDYWTWNGQMLAAIRWQYTTVVVYFPADFLRQ